MPTQTREEKLNQSPPKRRLKIGGQAPLQPTARLLVKLGSIIVHAQEFTSPRGHPLDKQAMEALLADYEVAEWIAAMNDLALLPVKR